MRDVVDHLTEVVRGLETAPIIMGHSFGESFVQLLLYASYGAALPITPEEFHYAFTNTLTDEQSQAAYDR